MAASLIFKDPCICRRPMWSHKSFFGPWTLPLYRYGPCADCLFFSQDPTSSIASSNPPFPRRSSRPAHPGLGPNALADRSTSATLTITSTLSGHRWSTVFRYISAAAQEVGKITPLTGILCTARQISSLTTDSAAQIEPTTQTIPRLQAPRTPNWRILPP